MRNLKIVTLVTLLTLSGWLMTNRAEALPLQGAPAIGIAAQENDIRQDVAYRCRRIWSCSRYTCGWRRACHWTPGPFAHAYPYLYRPHYRPYYRSYPRNWRGHSWRSHSWRSHRRHH